MLNSNKAHKLIILALILFLGPFLLLNPALGCEVNYNIDIGSKPSAEIGANFSGCDDLQLTSENPQFVIKSCFPACTREKDAVMLQTKQGEAKLNYAVNVSIPNVYGNPGLLGKLGENYGVMFEEHLFLSPSKKEVVKTSTASFQLPKGWQLVSPREVSGRKMVAHESLEGKYLGVGPFKTYKIGGSDYSIILATYPHTKLPEKRLIQVLNSSVAYFSSIYGDLPFSKSVVYSTGMMPGGTAKESSLFVSNTSSWQEAVHEFQHQWLGGKAEVVKWFGEGAVNYYTGKFLVKSGLWSRYRFEKLLSKSGKPRPLPKGDIEEEEYRRDLAHVSLALVNHLQKKTDGDFKRVLRHLYQQGEGGGKITNQDIQDSLANVTGNNYQTFFNRYVYRLSWFEIAQKRFSSLLDSFLKKVEAIKLATILSN